LDGGSIHKGPEVQALTTRCPRLHLEWFPGYAPELNPDEWVWAHFKAKLANGHPITLDDLMGNLSRISKNVTKRRDLIRSFIMGSELPSFL
jgi:transposase